MVTKSCFCMLLSNFNVCNNDYWHVGATYYSVIALNPSLRQSPAPGEIDVTGSLLVLESRSVHPMAAAPLSLIRPQNRTLNENQTPGSLRGPMAIGSRVRLILISANGLTYITMVAGVKTVSQTSLNRLVVRALQWCM